MNEEDGPIIERRGPEMHRRGNERVNFSIAGSVIELRNRLATGEGLGKWVTAVEGRGEHDGPASNWWEDKIIWDIEGSIAKMIAQREVLAQVASRQWGEIEGLRSRVGYLTSCMSPGSQGLVGTMWSCTLGSVDRPNHGISGGRGVL